MDFNPPLCWWMFQMLLTDFSSIVYHTKCFTCTFRFNRAFAKTKTRFIFVVLQRAKLARFLISQIIESLQ